MSTNTIRIEVVGQANISARIAIDRVIPPLLSNVMSSTEWDSLCNQVDNALSPLEDMRVDLRRLIRIRNILSSILTLVVVGVGVSCFLLLSRERRFFSAPITSAAFILALIPTCVFNAKIMKILSGADAILQDLQRTLEAESAKRLDLSYEIKKDQNIHTTTNNRVRTQTVYYIEAQIMSGASIPMGGNVDAPGPGTNTNGIFSAFDALAMGDYNNNNNYTSGGGKNAVVRLQELEAIKHLISEEEYQNKKDAIIASV